MSLILAEPDRTTRAFLTKALERARFRVTGVADGTQAWMAFEASQKARLLVIDAGALNPSRSYDICGAIRATGRPAYVIAMLPHNSRFDTLSALEAGADDVIARPVDHVELVGRLRRGLRNLEAMRPRLVSEAVRDAAESGESGELTVRSGDAFGRVHIVNGRVAWVHISSEPVSVANLIGEGVAADDMRAVVEECRSSGKNFASVLVEWGLVEHDLLRLRLGAWIAESLSMLVSQQQARTVFIPKAQNYPEDFTFELEELHLGTAKERESYGPTDTDFDVSLAGITGDWEVPDWLGEVRALTELAVAQPDIVSAIVLHEPTGQTLALAGIEVPRGILSAKLRLLMALRAEGTVGPIRSTLNGSEHAILQLANKSGCVLYVVFAPGPGDPGRLERLSALIPG